MLCEECRQRPAVVHLTRIVNNQKTEFHLCEECARSKSGEFGTLLQPHFSMQSFLTGLIGNEPEKVYVAEPSYTTPKCEGCGLTFADFRRSGRLGCSRCYDAFDTSLEPLLRRIHGAVRHTGKVPHRTGGSLRVRQEVEMMKRKLAEAVRKEEYEQAARLRDQIRQLEKGLE